MQKVIDALTLIPYLFVLAVSIYHMYGMLNIPTPKEEPTTLLGVVHPQEEKTSIK